MTMNDETTDIAPTDVEAAEAARADDFLEAIVEIAAEGLAFCQKKSVIKNKLNSFRYGVDEDGEPLGRMPRSAFEKIFAKARLHLQRRAAVTKVEAREDSIGFYEHIIGNENEQALARIRCRENLDKLMGNAVPDVHVIAQAKKKISLKDLGLNLAARKEALEKLRADRLAQPV
jgi:hypothetical protein